jgi:hypothetical protein
MNKPQLSTNYDTPSDFPTLGSFSIDDLENFSGTVVPDFNNEAKSQPQFHIIVKRDDGLYKTLNILNTVFSILAVLLIVATFVLVFYSLITITEVSEMVSHIKEHNALDTSPR